MQMSMYVCIEVCILVHMQKLLSLKVAKITRHSHAIYAAANAIRIEPAQEVVAIVCDALSLSRYLHLKGQSTVHFCILCSHVPHQHFL